MLRLAKRHASDGPAGLTCRPRRRPIEPACPPRRARGRCSSDTFILQREARGGPGLADRAIAYVVLGIVVAVWLGLLGVGARASPSPGAPAPPARYRGIGHGRRPSRPPERRRPPRAARRPGRRDLRRAPYDEVSIDGVAAPPASRRACSTTTSRASATSTSPSSATAADEMRRDTGRPRTPPDERLSAGLDRYLDYVEHHARGFAAVMRAGIGTDPGGGRRRRGLRAEMADRILDALPEARPPAGVRVAVRGWVGFAEAASLEWLEHREVSRGQAPRAAHRDADGRGRRGGFALRGAVSVRRAAARSAAPRRAPPVPACAASSGEPSGGFSSVLPATKAPFVASRASIRCCHIGANLTIDRMSGYRQAQRAAHFPSMMQLTRPLAPQASADDGTALAYPRRCPAAEHANAGGSARAINSNSMPEALIIVDVQNDFTPRGALAVPDGDAIPPPLNELGVDDRFGLVVATRDWHPPEHASFTAQGGRWPRALRRRQRGRAAASGARRGERRRHRRQGPRSGTEGYSGFDGTDLATLLRERGDRRGHRRRAGHGLLRARDGAGRAARAGFAVTVDRDASRGIDAERHRAAHSTRCAPPAARRRFGRNPNRTSAQNGARVRADS